MQQALDIRDFEIERRLDAYARARLSPDPTSVARTRARVMREARLQFEAARSAAQVEVARTAAHAVPAITMVQRRPLARRLAMPLLAASVWVGIAVGSVAASQAGGPLYPTRVWIEASTLPTAAAERAAAELSRLDVRLGEALSAAARGDAGGVAAALAAYRSIADETIAATSGDEDLEALIGAALARHQAVLTAVAESLEAKGNTTAANAVETAIQRAIDHNAAVVAGFADNGGGRGGDGGADSATGGGSTGGQTMTSGGGTGGSGGNAGGNGGAVGADNGNGQDGGDKPTKPPKATPAATVEPSPDERPSAPSGEGQGESSGDGGHGGNQP